MIRETDTATGELYRLRPDDAIWWAIRYRSGPTHRRRW